MIKTTWRFPEEQQPCGSADFKFLTGRWADLVRVAPAGTVVERVKTHPWFVIIWEPLTTKVPNPCLAQPYCCYVFSVVFYVRGYILRPWIHLYKISSKWEYSTPGQRYEEWCTVDHTFTYDDIIEFENEKFKLGGGTVLWYNKRWWMRYSARRDKQLTE